MVSVCGKSCQILISAPVAALELFKALNVVREVFDYIGTAHMFVKWVAHCPSSNSRLSERAKPVIVWNSLPAAKHFFSCFANDFCTQPASNEVSVP